MDYKGKENTTPKKEFAFPVKRADSKFKAAVKVSMCIITRASMSAAQMFCSRNSNKVKHRVCKGINIKFVDSKPL